MERLLKEADALSESFNLQVDASGELVYSYADIVDAIHIVQEEWGIAGATAEEAGITIEGSVNSMRAAWENLVTGISDGNADIDELVNDLVITIAGDGTENNLGAFGNIIPAVENALNGASKVVEKLFPKLIGMLPSILENTLPSLAQSAMSVVESIIQTISENGDQLSESITGAISSILIHAAENTPDLIGALIELVLSLISGLGENLGTIVPALAEFIVLTISEVAKNTDNLTGAIFSIIDGIVDVLTSPDGIAKMTAAGFELLMGLITGIITSLPKTAEGIIQLVDTIVGNITETDWEGVGSDLVGKIGEGLKTAWEEIEAAFVTAGETIVSTLEGWGPKLSTFGSEVSEKFEEIKEEAKTLVEEFKSKILESDWYQTGKDMVLEIKDGIVEIASEAVQWGKDLIENFISGITQKWEDLKMTVARVAQSVRDFIGFSEPKKGPLSNFHTYAPDMMELFAKGIRDNEHIVTDQIQKSFDFGEQIGGEYGDGIGIKKTSGFVAGGTSIGSVTINIDGARYEDEQSLAAAISEAIQNMTDRRAAVYA